MPPKAEKAEKKADTKTKKAAILDGISTDTMTKEQLVEHVIRVKDELEREREERNYFQLERDKIATFWEITKTQLDEKKAELRNKDREIEDNEERHQVEIKVFKQKIKYLMFENQNNLAELRAESLINLKLAEQEHISEEQTLSKDKRDLKMKQKEDEMTYIDTMKELKLKHSEQMTELRMQFEKDLTEIEDRYEKKMRNLRDELDLRRKTEIHEVEERKNQQISNLMKSHDKAFTEIKNYYNDITVNNLALINSLKDQVEDLKNRHDYVERLLNESTSENRKLHETINVNKQKITELKKELETAANTKTALVGTKAKLKSTTEELKALKWEQEILEQRFKIAEKERDEIYGKFISTVQEVQQKCGLKNLLLEKKLSVLVEALEKKDAQLSEVLAASNLDPTALSVVTRRLEDLLDSKNNAIKDLQGEVAKLSKAHDEMLQTFLNKLKQYGIQTDDLGFIPLETTAMGQKLGKGPAGLVAECQLR